MYPLDFYRMPGNVIAPRPKPIDTLHPVLNKPAPATDATTKHMPANIPSTPHVPQSAITEDSESEVAELLTVPDNDSIAARRTQRVVKPSTKMRESLEYLGHTCVNLANADLDDELAVPCTYTEAMCRPDVWLEPMMRELQVMNDKSVYRLIPHPLGKNVVKSKWVFVNKYDESGTVFARKACLVAKGFTQIIGKDYGETYVSVAHLESVCLVCAIAASMGLHLWQINFVFAFLNSENEYGVYMEQPPGFEEGGDNIWLLLKTLYGTMQGTHDWAKTLEITYQDHRHYTSKANPQVHSHVEGDEITLTSTWTDNILGASLTEAGEIKAKAELQSSYELKDLGMARFILGMKIDRDVASGTITLSQWAYSKWVLKHFHMAGAKPRSTPLPAGLVLSTDDMPTSKEEIQEMKDIPYREALGSLMWLQVAT